MLGDKNVRREDFMRNGVHDHSLNFVSVMGLVIKKQTTKVFIWLSVRSTIHLK